MKKIILTTDFSENAWNAIFTALKVYAKVPCQFYILHAYEPAVLNVLGKKSQQRLGVIYDSLSTYSEQELEEILKYLKINHLNPKHHFTSISKSGTLEEAISTVIFENDIDLIIMGTQGASGAKEVFLGSNTVKVIKSIKNTPLLAVPVGYNFQKLKTIVLATDFMLPYKKHELDQLIALASIWSAKIEIVHVTVASRLNDAQKANRSTLEGRLEAFDFQFKDIPFEVNISNSVNKYIANKPSCILGIIRHQHTFWEKVIGEPVVKKIAFHSQIPVLFLPE